MGKRRKTHEFEDQYGEARGGDRDDFGGGGAGGRGGGRMGGGGRAGGGRPGTNVAFQRQLPKFLQPYAHMLGGGQAAAGGEGGEEGDSDDGDGAGGERAPAEALRRKRAGAGGSDDDDDDGDDDGDHEAIKRALEDDPELAAQLGARVAQRVEAAAAKEEGNRAFGAKKYEDALRHFTRAVELDPQ